MATVTFEQATHFYPGAERPAVDRLDLEIGDGEFMVLVGPSGCGKSTCLRMLAGLEDVDSGRILLGERDITDLAPKLRDIAMVFQNYALYSHMSVAENIGFALKVARVPKREIARRVADTATMLDIEPLLDRKPKSLSGGQRQRVALGRAIVRMPKVFLLDEPLSNLDAKLRVSTRTQIAALQRRLGITTIYVTHDQVEAMTMGDRVAVLLDGVLQQVDTPLRLYAEPANVFVAGFMGSPAMNLLAVGHGESGLELFGPPAQVFMGGSAILTRTAGPLILGLRPEDMQLVSSGHGVPTRVELVEDLGPNAFLHGTVTVNGADQPIIARVPGTPPAPGDIIHLAAKPGRVHVFSAATGTRIAPVRAVLRVA